MNPRKPPTRMQIRIEAIKAYQAVCQSHPLNATQRDALRRSINAKLGFVAIPQSRTPSGK